MRTRTMLLIPALLMALTAGTAAAGPSIGESASATHPDRFTGNLVDTFSTRANRPFILSVDHYTPVSEVRRFNDILTGQGLYHLRDELWRQDAGYVSFGGLGYPVAAVLSQDTPSGRTLRVIINRPEWLREVQSYARSSKYPFTVLELNLDRNGKGDGEVIGAAKLQLQGDDLQIKSLSTIPLRLLDVREG